MIDVFGVLKLFNNSSVKQVARERHSQEKKLL